MLIDKQSKKNSDPLHLNKFSSLSRNGAMCRVKSGRKTLDENNDLKNLNLTCLVGWVLVDGAGSWWWLCV